MIIPWSIQESRAGDRAQSVYNSRHRKATIHVLDVFQVLPARAVVTVLSRAA